MGAVERYSDYDPFAWLYHTYWGTEFHEQALDVLDRLILHRLPEHSKILDLCCGDGRICAQLLERGYRVTGLDGSERMLAFARKRNPAVKLVLADARDFQLEQKFHGVISTFDSLNHIPRTKDLLSVFRNVHSVLRPGGYFAFDLNREQAYIELWSHTSATVDAHAVSVARGSYDRRRRVARCDITLLRATQQMHWERSDFTLKQTCHKHERVAQYLQDAGFCSATSLDAASDLGMSGEIGIGRTFYLARR